MDLTYHGGRTVRLKGRDVLVAIDPPDAARRPEPDIVVRTDGPTNSALLRGGLGGPQEVAGPGEYELRGVSVLGLAAGETTVMRVDVDDVRVLAVGRLDRQLTEEEVDEVGHVDVLLVPVGTGHGPQVAVAAGLVNEIEPGVVVPVGGQSADGDAGREALDKFVKEMGGADGWTPQAKLTLTGSLGDPDETRVVVLEARP